MAPILLQPRVKTKYGHLKAKILRTGILICDIINILLTDKTRTLAGWPALFVPGGIFIIIVILHFIATMIIHLKGLGSAR